MRRVSRFALAALVASSSLVMTPQAEAQPRVPDAGVPSILAPVPRDAGRAEQGPLDGGAREGEARDASARDAAASEAVADAADADAAIGASTASEPGALPEEEEPPPPEGHRPTLNVTIRTDGVRTGDLVRLVINAEVPAGDDVGVPEQSFGAFEVHDRRFRSELVANGARRRFVFELDLLALEPGEHELPGTRLRVVTADGQVGAVRTDARMVTVASHLANEPDAQPKPPTRPRPVFEKDYTLLWVGVALLAILLTALVSWWVSRWWAKRPKGPKAAPPPRPPWEVALEQLAVLRREKAALVASEKQVELVDRVSDVLRQYLGQRYDFNGLESTTDEVVARLSKVKLRGVAIEEVTALLGDSDLVKFARAVPDEAQCDRMLEGAYRIVQATTPRVENALVNSDATSRETGVQSAPGARGSASARALDGGQNAQGAPPRRSAEREAELALRVTASSIEEAERAIRVAVEARLPEALRDPHFEGRVRVVVGPTLPADANATDALRRLQARLETELASLASANGQPLRVRIEHVQAPAPRARETDRAGGATLTGEAVADADAASQPSGAQAQPREAGRMHTGPVTWDSRSVRASEALGTVLAETTPTENESASSAPIVDTRELARVTPVFHLGTDAPPAGALLRWVTGLERPVLYAVDGGAPWGTSALATLELSRTSLHERAVANLRRVVPKGFAPSDEPALLDDPSQSVLLALPELVPVAEAWIAYPLRDEGLVVMREGAASTHDELQRLAAGRAHDAIFERPVRVTRRGFEPLDWPSAERSTDPGFSTPGPGGES